MTHNIKFTGKEETKWGITYKQLKMTPDHPLYEPNDYLMGWVTDDVIIEGDVYISQRSYVEKGSRLTGDVHLFGKGRYGGVDIEGKVVMNNFKYTTVENSTIRGIFSSDFLSSIIISDSNIDGVVLLNNKGSFGKDCRAVFKNLELSGNLSLTFAHSDKYGSEPQFVHIMDSNGYGTNVLTLGGRECYVNIDETIFRDFELTYHGNRSTVNITSCNLTETKLEKIVKDEASRLGIENFLAVCEPIKLEADGEDNE